jgi:bifunctional non-homologous end joining protein LigD
MFDMPTIGFRDRAVCRYVSGMALLRDSFEDTGSFVFTNSIAGAGEWVFEQVVFHGFEGMIANRLDSLYLRGRTHEWQKIKYAGYGRPAALGFR